ncbi:restriction endonuclease subunit S [Terrimesophilobacter mesophilus]|nr:restriction endonuclease subunit S [Terrimesophilobacter mesophilus]
MAHDWEILRLGAVAEIYDGPHATPHKTDSGPWYLSISSLIRGRVQLSESAHLSPEDFPKWTRRVQPTPGDTLFSYETRIGDAAHWSIDSPAALGRRMGLLRPRPNVDPRFLTYAYLGDEFQGELRRRTIHGATVDRLAISEMPDWPIRIPPIAEQRRIAGVLGALDDLIDTNEQLKELLSGLQDALFSELVEASRSSIDFGSLAEQVKVRAGVDPEIAYLGLEHFAENGRGISTAGRLGDTVSQQYAFESGDILYGRLRPYFRKVDRPGFSGACSGEIWVLRPRNDVPSSFLHSLVASQRFTDFAMAGSGGTHMPRARWDHVSTLSVPFPSAEQLARFDSIAEPLWEQSVALAEEIDVLRRTRDELLPLLMSGKVRVSSDEVADQDVQEGAE